MVRSGIEWNKVVYMGNLQIIEVSLLWQIPFRDRPLLGTAGELYVYGRIQPYNRYEEPANHSL